MEIPEANMSDRERNPIEDYEYASKQDVILSSCARAWIRLAEHYKKLAELQKERADDAERKLRHMYEEHSILRE